MCIRLFVKYILPAALLSIGTPAQSASNSILFLMVGPRPFTYEPVDDKLEPVNIVGTNHFANIDSEHVTAARYYVEDTDGETLRAVIIVMGHPDLQHSRQVQTYDVNERTFNQVVHKLPVRNRRPTAASFFSDGEHQLIVCFESHDGFIIGPECHRLRRPYKDRRLFAWGRLIEFSTSCGVPSTLFSVYDYERESTNLGVTTEYSVYGPRIAEWEMKTEYDLFGVMGDDRLCADVFGDLVPNVHALAVMVGGDLRLRVVNLFDLNENYTLNYSTAISGNEVLVCGGFDWVVTKSASEEPIYEWMDAEEPEVLSRRQLGPTSTCHLYDYGQAWHRQQMGYTLDMNKVRVLPKITLLRNEYELAHIFGGTDGQGKIVREIEAFNNVDKMFKMKKSLLPEDMPPFEVFGFKTYN